MSQQLEALGVANGNWRGFCAWKAETASQSRSEGLRRAADALEAQEPIVMKARLDRFLRSIRRVQRIDEFLHDAGIHPASEVRSVENLSVRQREALVEALRARV